MSLEAKLELKVETSAAAVDSAVATLVCLLQTSLGEADLKMFQVCIHEALRNAYEHGNLGLSFSEKTALLETHNFEAELEQRAVLARQKGLFIQVSAELAEGCFKCEIQDQGQGFDLKSLREPTQDEIALSDTHGRGVFLIRKYFSQVEYLGRGNVLRLLKSF